MENRTIFNIQMQLAEKLPSIYEAKIIWNLLSDDQALILDSRLRNQIPECTREFLFQNIWAQNECTNCNALSSIIFVFVTSETDIQNAKRSREFTCHPVLRTSKCDDHNDSLNSSNFIDENGRVFCNWQVYLSSCELPKGTLVAPASGYYTLNNMEIVNLECQQTSAGVDKKEPTIFDIQTSFAKSSGYNTEIIWDLLSKEQDYILKEKILNLIPDQEKGQNVVIQMRETLFESIWAQRKYTNRNLLSSIIYVLVTSETDLAKVKDSQHFSCHPVFRTRKCVNEEDSSKCCMIFIDEVGRVYQNWNTYIRNNELPKGTMVAPSLGVYTFDANEIVNLEFVPTPASSVTAKIINTTDNVTTLSAVLSAGVCVAASFTAVIAAPVVAGAGVVGLACASYSTLRSGSTLIDRKFHEQSIGLTNRDARGSWISVAGGIIGMGASGATRILRAAAASGTEITALSLAVNGINITSIVLSGTGIANGILDIILKKQNDEDIKTLDILQLASSFVLFTHSVNNFSMASNIVTEIQQGKIKSISDGLSNKQRKMFNKMAKETIRTKGTTQGRMDIIRSANDIPSKQFGQHLNDLNKINRQLNQKNIRPSFGGAKATVLLNNELSVDTKVLRNNVQHNIGPSVLAQVTQPIPVSLSNSNSLNLQTPHSVPQLAAGFISLPSGVVLVFSQFGQEMFSRIQNGESFEDIVKILAEEFCEKSFVFLMNLARKFIDNKCNQINLLLRRVISTESILFRILTMCLNNFTDRSFEFLKLKEEEILEALNQYFRSLSADNNPDLLKQCQQCSGYFGTCDL